MHRNFSFSYHSSYQSDVCLYSVVSARARTHIANTFYSVRQSLDHMCECVCAWESVWGSCMCAMCMHSRRLRFFALLSFGALLIQARLNETKWNCINCLVCHNFTCSHSQYALIVFPVPYTRCQCKFDCLASFYFHFVSPLCTRPVHTFILLHSTHVCVVDTPRKMIFLSESLHPLIASPSHIVRVIIADLSSWLYWWHDYNQLVQPLRFGNLLQFPLFLSFNLPSVPF